MKKSNKKKKDAIFERQKKEADLKEKEMLSDWFEQFSPKNNPILKERVDSVLSEMSGTSEIPTIHTVSDANTKRIIDVTLFNLSTSINVFLSKQIMTPEENEFFSKFISFVTPVFVELLINALNEKKNR